MVLNVSKTKSVLFSRTKTVGVSLFFEGARIEDVKCVRFLGLYLDAPLSFEHHSHLLHLNLVNCIFILQKLSLFVPQSCLKTLYYAHFYSKLTYGLNIWYPLIKEKERQKFNILQKRLIRIVSLVNSCTHCMPLFRKSNMLLIEGVVKIQNLVIMFRISNDLSPQPVTNLFKKCNHQYSTR